MTHNGTHDVDPISSTTLYPWSAGLATIIVSVLSIKNVAQKCNIDHTHLWYNYGLYDITAITSCYPREDLCSVSLTRAIIDNDIINGHS